MRFLLLLYCVLFSIVYLSAKTYYYYDANGHCFYRTETEFVHLKAAPTLPALTIKVTPNPTDGPLYVTIEGLETPIRIKYTISDTFGNLIIADFISTSSFDIDISSLNKGLYILTIYCDQFFEGTQIIRK